MRHSLLPRAAALGLSTLVTWALLSGIATLSVSEHAAQDLLAAGAVPAQTAQADPASRPRS